jgi:hypothetical protein
MGDHWLQGNTLCLGRGLCNAQGEGGGGVGAGPGLPVDCVPHSRSLHAGSPIVHADDVGSTAYGCSAGAHRGEVPEGGVRLISDVPQERLSRRPDYLWRILQGACTDSPTPKSDKHASSSPYYSWGFRATVTKTTQINLGALKAWPQFAVVQTVGHGGYTFLQD